MIDVDIRLNASDDVAVVRLRGELDISSSTDLDRELQRLEQSTPPVVVLDLRELAFIDSTGLRLVLNADARARAGGWRLVMLRGPERVDRVFRVALLDRRLEFALPSEVGLEDEEEFAGS